MSEEYLPQLKRLLIAEVVCSQIEIESSRLLRFLTEKEIELIFTMNFISTGERRSKPLSINECTLAMKSTAEAIRQNISRINKKLYHLTNESINLQNLFIFDSYTRPQLKHDDLKLLLRLSTIVSPGQLFMIYNKFFEDDGNRRLVPIECEEIALKFGIGPHSVRNNLNAANRRLNASGLNINMIYLIEA